MSRQPLTAAEVARADAIIVALAKLWPSGFAVYQRRRRPLAIGIDQTLMARLEPAIAAEHVTTTDISLALARYTGADGYLQNTVAGAPRIGLDGKPTGVVTEKQAQRAQALVAKRKARRQANGNYDLKGKAAPEAPTRPETRFISRTALPL